MLAQQSLATMSGLTVPVLAPAISRDLALDPGLIGAYTAFIYGVSMVASLGGGTIQTTSAAEAVAEAANCDANFDGVL